MRFKALLFSALAVVAASCASSTQSTVSGNNDKNSSKTVPVSITDEKGSAGVYNPAVLSIPVGTELVFTNKSEVPHNVVWTKYSGLKPAQSDLLSKNQSYTVLLTTEGDYTYICTLHPTMSGSVSVFSEK